MTVSEMPQEVEGGLSGETVFMPGSDKLAQGTARRDRCGCATGMQNVHASGRLRLWEWERRKLEGRSGL